MPLRDLREKARRDPLRETGAFLLQEDQQRDARHRQQQHRQHRLGQRAGACQMAELGEAQRQAEGQEHHLRHRLGGGVGGDGGGGIGRHSCPCRIISRAAATMPPTGEKGEISAMESRTSRAR